jgi:hypothetical protein
MLIEEYNNDLGMKLWTDMIDHDRPHSFARDVYLFIHWVWLRNCNTLRISCRARRPLICL